MTRHRAMCVLRVLYAAVAIVSISIAWAWLNVALIITLGGTP